MKKILGFVSILFFSIGLFAQSNAFRKFNVSEQQLKAHKLKLPNAADIRSSNTVDLKVEDNNETKKVIFRKFTPPTPRPTPAFDANYFGPIVHELLKDKVMGYMYQVYQGNTAIYTGLWNWARNPNDGDKGWTADTRMHIASASKLMTAIGLVRLLDKKNISLDASISPYLPTYWKKGNGVGGLHSVNYSITLQGFREKTLVAIMSL